MLERLKREIGGARTRAVLAVNRELIALYWRIGSEILERQGREGWGAKVIKRLSHDLRAAFPDMKGLSEANLRHMRAFAQTWPEWGICSHTVSKLPWGHTLGLIYKLDDSAARLWYAERAVAEGWSRRLLEHHIATGRFEREGRALTNFAHTLPAAEGELAQ